MNTDSMSCDTLPETEPTSKRFRRGDVREDGRIFWSYEEDKECWATPIQFIRWRDTEASRQARRIKALCEGSETPKHRLGDVREDGKIFRSYSRTSANGERWLSPEQFSRERDLARNQKRGRALDESPEQREYRKQNTKKWQRDNAGHVLEKKYQRLREDPVFAMSWRFRGLMSSALRKRNFVKKSSSSSVIGLPWKEFAEYIESRFLPGMSWNNRDQWHLDHIVPQALAKTEQDVIDLNHYSNLRPLWAEANIAKGDSMPPRELVPEHLLRFIDPSS